jgi:hypothetical protein
VHCTAPSQGWKWYSGAFIESRTLSYAEKNLISWQIYCSALLKMPFLCLIKSHIIHVAAEWCLLLTLSCLCSSLSQLHPSQPRGKEYWYDSLQKWVKSSRLEWHWSSSWLTLPSCRCCPGSGSVCCGVHKCCPKGNTCCGTTKCCPSVEGVCCSDVHYCCDKGWGCCTGLTVTFTERSIQGTTVTIILQV